MGSQAAKPDDQQSLLDDTDEVTLIEKISVVIMGHHGVGKNTVGNALLKKKAFTFTDRSKTYYLKEEYTTNNRHIVVTRVPGWSADLSSQKNAHLWPVIKDSVQSFVDGPNVIMLVVGTNTIPAETTKEKLKEILGDSVAQHILTVSVDGQKIVVYHSARKQTIINRCKYHYFVRCMCGKQNRNLIESIEDFIVYKQDIHFQTSVQHKKTEQLEHVSKQEEHVMMKAFQKQIGVQFLKKNHNKLIERIVAVKPIADELLQFIGHHKYDMILQAPTEYEQKRQLFNITQKGGEKLQIEFYQCLLKHEKYLVEDLKESS
ncbi:hypothetical protein HF521_019862 [Silurus meridionalis]|uniref:CARD domain-containing protein n=1 Tax=Silurus meridionalis TaxID=175797 RepID=A0A8T0BHQ3_SILME|nr:hypothetical protein HF521_019862 [Silurus meridionalis]